MRYFKGKIPVWFRGDSTLLDFEFKSLKDLYNFYLKPKTKNTYKPVSTYIKFKIRKIFLTLIYKNIDKAFYVGTHNKEYFQAHGINDKQLVCLPHTIDDEFFTRDTRSTGKIGIRMAQIIGYF